MGAETHSRGLERPSVTAAEAWGAACKELADETANTMSPPSCLRELFGKVSRVVAGTNAAGLPGNVKGKSKGGTQGGCGEEEDAWSVLFDYFNTLRRALRDMRRVAMAWALRAASDPASDPAALLRAALDAHPTPEAEAFRAAAAALHKWLPVDTLSESAVHAALSARQLATPSGGDSSGGGGRGEGGSSGEAQVVLKDMKPNQRLQVAKELMETGKAAPALVREVLASVAADAGDDATVTAEAQRLRCVSRPLLAPLPCSPLAQPHC